MSVESGTTISDLSSNWPLNGDPILEGDDHIRLIKQILKSQFPGAEGDGLASPVNLTEEEFANLAGLSSSAQGQIDAINVILDQAVYDIAKNINDIGTKASTIALNDGLATKAATKSTSSVFGGIKHTFSNGTLNIITV